MSAQTLIRPSLPVTLGPTLRPLRHGARDPTIRRDPTGAWWRATRTPYGPATVRYAQATGGIEVRAWGPGADWAISAAPELLGSKDSLAGFDPGRGLIRDLHRRMPGLRVTRSRAVFEAMVPIVIEQKVIGRMAHDAYRAMVLAWSETAPGPGDLLLPLDPRQLAAMPYHEFHPLGVEMKRANTVRAVASRAGRLEEAPDMEPSRAQRRLMSITGVGAWTAAEVAIVALGDADAVSVGDYHLPHTVSWALAGEARGSDERMLELLQPFQGHRGRVIRLLTAAGIAAPRFGPRMAINSFARF